jgi:hypothetical protein
MTARNVPYRSMIFRKACGGAIGLATAFFGICGAAQAHQFTMTEALVVFKTDGTFQIDMIADVDALALGVPDTADSAELAATLRAMTADELQERIDHAANTVSRRVRVRFDGEKSEPWITFPDYGTPLTTEAEIPTVLGTTIRLTGRIPGEAETFTFGASRAFRAVHLAVFDQRTATGLQFVLGPSEDSPPLPLDVGAGGKLLVVQRRLDVAVRYLILGFEHILPLGLDHILFVLGLFLLSPKLRPVLWQVTAFTVAHSVTLALSIYGVVSLPSVLVESMIALSIAYVAVENMLTSELKPWRPVVVFLFGLLHGLGFADVLLELGLPRDQFVAALITFNIGVELGQLTVVGLAFLAVGWFRNRTWYRKSIVIPLSALIALVGLYWCVERAFMA